MRYGVGGEREAWRVAQPPSRRCGCVGSTVVRPNPRPPPRYRYPRFYHSAGVRTRLYTAVAWQCAKPIQCRAPEVFHNAAVGSAEPVKVGWG